MTDKNDGGPAYPTDGEMHSGMTLRDYFAAAALTGLLADNANLGGDRWAPAAARLSYEIADLMLVARERD